MKEATPRGQGLSALESLLLELSEVSDSEKHLTSIPKSLGMKAIILNRGVRNTSGSTTNLRKCNKAKCKVLYPDQDNPQYQHRLQINCLRQPLKKRIWDTDG